MTLQLGSPPFAVSDGMDAHRDANLRLAKIYSTLMEGDTNFSFCDMELISTKMKLSVPVTFMDFINSLGIFGILLGTLFGNLHPLVGAYLV
jgi:hypothetical protein